MLQNLQEYKVGLAVARKEGMKPTSSTDSMLIQGKGLWPLRKGYECLPKIFHQYKAEISCFWGAGGAEGWQGTACTLDSKRQVEQKFETAPPLRTRHRQPS